MGLPNLSDKNRKEIWAFIRKTTDEAFALSIDLSGKYLSEDQIERARTEAETEMTETYKAATTAYKERL